MSLIDPKLPKATNDFQAIRLETDCGDLVEVVEWPHKRQPGPYLRRHGRLFKTTSMCWRQCAVFKEIDADLGQDMRTQDFEDLK